jgi:hypothetical protein
MQAVWWCYRSRDVVLTTEAGGKVYIRLYNIVDHVMPTAALVEHAKEVRRRAPARRSRCSTPDRGTPLYSYL